MNKHPDQSIHIAINGCHGRMGARIDAMTQHDASFTVAARIDAAGAHWSGAKERVDAVIDFSNDVGACGACAFAATHNAALLVATTAISDATRDVIKQASQTIPVIIAPNTSYGVAVVDNLLTVAARMLAEHFDVSIVETHHSRKRDRPSGTALRLADTIEQSTGCAFDHASIHAIRGGDIVGEHEIIFAGDEEVIRLSHAALSRDVFARGALRAVQWLVRQKPGQYDIRKAWGLA